MIEGEIPCRTAGKEDTPIVLTPESRCLAAPSQAMTQRRIFLTLRQSTTRLPRPMPSRRFPKPWKVEPMASGYRVIPANGVLCLRMPDAAIAISDSRLTNDEARRIPAF
jgi:hypothetical protein